MTTLIVYVVVLTLLVPPVGTYMYRVYTSERTGRIEGLIYRLIGVDPTVEQTWRRYAVVRPVVQRDRRGARLRLDAHPGASAR